MMRWMIGLLFFFTVSLAAQQPNVESRTVTISWEAVLNANYYEILFINDEGKEFNYKTPSAEWSGTLPYGKYNLKIRSYDSRDVPGKWGTDEVVYIKYKAISLNLPKNKSRIKSSNAQKYMVNFSWSQAGPAATYKLKIKAKNSDFQKEIEVQNTQSEQELPVANIYTWSVQPYYKDIAGEVSEESVFALLGPKLENPKFKKPENEFTDVIEWTQSDYTKQNLLKIEQKTQNGWKTVGVKKIKESKVDLSSFEGGEFKLSLMSKAPLRKSSDVVSMEHFLNPKRRDPAFVKQQILKDSIAKPTDYYFIASYLVTQINYKNFDLENNRQSQFDALGGTGRLGMGWKDQDSPWGVSGVFDLSGFNLGEKNFSFPSLEVHTTYMTKPLEIDQLNFSAGLYTRELPVLNAQDSTVYDVQTISQLGAHAGFNYWYPLTKDYGLKVHSHAYYGLPSGKAPNGESVESELSYQYGLLASYRMSKNWMGLIGYTYRLDKMKYKANQNNTSDPSLTSNTVEYGGHYLNLQLEINF